MAKSHARAGSKAPTAGTQVATSPAANTQLAPVADFSSYAGMGLENLGKDEMSIPFLSIVQKMSKVVDELPGARAGMLFNTVTKELYDAETPGPGVKFVPVDRAKMYNEWVPLNQGGGFKGQHAPGSELVVETLKQPLKDQNKPGVWKLANGHELVETFYVYGFIVHPEENGSESMEPALISFTSTGIKSYRNWMTRASALRWGGFQPPLFAVRYVLRTLKKSNDKGTWHVLDVTLDGTSVGEAIVSEQVLQQGLSFHKTIQAGAARPATESLVVDAEIVDEGDDAPM